MTQRRVIRIILILNVLAAIYVSWGAASFFHTQHSECDVIPSDPSLAWTVIGGSAIAVALSALLFYKQPHITWLKWLLLAILVLVSFLFYFIFLFGMGWAFWCF
ncbi:MAG TPA: hypothetical protein VG604_03375 [Candidatus Saccharimonadales bacterium]|nr:hypothetical protein [Candidatus Saccharimonadales bacterium]